MQSSPFPHLDGIVVPQLSCGPTEFADRLFWGGRDIILAEEACSPILAGNGGIEKAPTGDGMLLVIIGKASAVGASDRQSECGFTPAFNHVQRYSVSPDASTTAQV
jgi:hypothetical protein